MTTHLQARWLLGHQRWHLGGDNCGGRWCFVGGATCGCSGEAIPPVGRGRWAWLEHFRRRWRRQWLIEGITDVKFTLRRRWQLRRRHPKIGMLGRTLGRHMGRLGMAMLLRVVLLVGQGGGLLQQQFVPHGCVFRCRGCASGRHGQTSSWWRRRRWHSAVIEGDFLGIAYVPNARSLDLTLCLMQLPELRVVRGRTGAPQQIGQQTPRTSWRWWWSGWTAVPSRRGVTPSGQTHHYGTQVVRQWFALHMTRLVGLRVRT